MKKLFALFLVVMTASAMSACNTVQGIGKDVKKVGEVVESAGKK